jgi:hypothetical protein
MPRKVFTAGEVLAAADVNEFLMDQAVMSFADTAARGSAIGTPVEGMVTYLEDLNRYDTYNGSSHVPMGGLTLIKTQTIGSTVSSVVVSDAFSADYENYKITITGGVGSADSSFTFQLGSQTTGYYAGTIFNVYSTNTASAAGVNNGSAFLVVGALNTAGQSMNLEVTSPFLAARTSIFAPYARQNTAANGGFTSGFLNTSDSFTGFTVGLNTGTMTGGTIRVYGYKKA